MVGPRLQRRNARCRLWEQLEWVVCALIARAAGHPWVCDPVVPCAAAASDGQQVSIAPGDVTAIRLCPLQNVNGPRRTVNVDSGDPGFTQLTAALAAPDGHSSPQTACPAYADLPQTVIAETSEGPMLLHIPVDGCGHYLSEPLTLLTALRGGHTGSASGGSLRGR